MTNQGTGPGTVATWTDSVIASPDDNPADGTTLAQFTHQGLLAAAAGYTEAQTFLLPPDFQGPYHLFVQTNATSTVFENGSTGNNTAEAPNLFDVTPTAYADLVVSSVTVPPAAASGQSIALTWTVANQGIGTTSTGTWSDDVSLATDPDGTGIFQDLGHFDHIGALAPGGSYTHTVDADLPDGLQGTFYVVVRTGGPYEFIYTGNDTGVAGPVTVGSPRHPTSLRPGSSPPPPPMRATRLTSPGPSRTSAPGMRTRPGTTSCN